VPAGRPVTPRQRARVIELAKEGMSRNDIARKTKLAAGTVTKIVHAEGLSFDREATRRATEAKQADSKARRAVLAALQLDDAFRLRERLWEPSTQLVSGPTGTERITLELPPARDTRDFVASVAGCVKSHIELEKLDTDSGAAGARSMLGELGAALQIAAGTLNGTTEGGEVT